MNLQYKRIVGAVCVFVAVAFFLATTLFVRSRSWGEKRPTVLGPGPLNRTNVSPGTPVKPGTELRILPLGDSITQGWLSDEDGGDGNGYRLQLRQDLSEDEVVFAGTEVRGSMYDAWFAAWPGKTIQYISENVPDSLKQRPNLILLHAGTNDMDDRPDRGKQGNEPKAAAERLGNLIDQLIEACPDAVILVAVIIGTCDPHKSPGTPEYQSLIPATVQTRRDEGHRVLAVDFSTFPEDQLRDCIHPTNDGYKELGHYWYDFITQIPANWIGHPVGDDPARAESTAEGAKMRPSRLMGLVGLPAILGLVLWTQRVVTE
ncbi:carbohydrate esterase family 3 protein [Thelonectria olida]|uniref:Carbohydrate esterase family 3 protein n=1 Tax=Thelonectria olida TaxID=1576542 RepID=A0A9P8W939_9HYPO|nr:carbohydrate esterase family 3 protein [Thelonectria olida]